MSTILTVVDWFAPHARSVDDRTRSRLVVLASLLLVLLGGPLVSEYAATTTDGKVTMISFAIGFVTITANPFLLRLTGATRAVAALLVVELMAVLAFQAHDNGGLGAPAFAWNFVVPPFAVLVIGWRGAAVATAVLIVEATVFHVLHELGHVFPQPLTDLQLRWWRFIGLVLVASLLGSLAWTYDKMRSAAWWRLHTTLDNLRGANQALLEARQAAERAASTKLEFLANMSHEIRTPMNAVLGMTTVLLDGELDDKQLSHVETIRKSGEHLLDTINLVLDFSKLDGGHLVLERRSFAVRPWLERWVEEAEERGHPVRHTLDDQAGERLLADDTRLGQLLRHLLDDASGGDTTAGVAVEARVTTGGDRAELHLRLEVTADPARRPRGRDGSDEPPLRGLSREVARRLLEVLGGRSTVQPTPEGYATTVVVPVDVDASPPTSELTLPPSSKSLAILLVEDNVINQRVALALLAKLGFEADLAKDGVEAVEAAERRAYDVILMDMQMPRMDGAEATRRIRAQAGPGPVIVALTANSIAEHRRACLEAGMNAYLEKPIRHAELERLLRGLRPRRA
ncbi:MAG: response regulator [Polyangiaceae bacterium]